jgi:hypothetical protein
LTGPSPGAVILLDDGEIFLLNNPLPWLPCLTGFAHIPY